MGMRDFDYRFSDREKPVIHGNGLTSQPDPSYWQGTNGTVLPPHVRRSQAMKKWWAEKKARERGE
jgi:hypothetical protein